MVLLLFYLFLALFVSFLCSILESVLLSTPQSYIVTKVSEGKKWSIKLLELKQNVDRPLSAILSLNTVAHTIGAAGVGAQAVKVFGEASFGYVSAVLTILILIITEIIPKTIGARYWRKLSSFTVNVLKIMMVIAYPLIQLASIITRLISKGGNQLMVSREEISALTSIGTEEGIISDSENKIIQNLLRLKNVRVSEVMTPRIVVTMANSEMTLEEFAKTMGHFYFSRIPVYLGNEENVIGYVFRDIVFEKIADNKQDIRLSELKRDIIVVPENKPLFALWELLLERKEHIALVVDEYGGMDGIVTLEDVIETIFGLEIVDEKDAVEDMQKYARERWEKRQIKYHFLNGM